MSAIVAGTPESNALYVRRLAQCIKPGNKTRLSTCALSFRCCVKQMAFATMTVDEAEDLLPALQSTLVTPSLKLSTLALRIIIEIARAAPPKILVSHWVTLAQKIIALLKSRTDAANPNLHPQALTALGILVAAAAPVTPLGGEHKAAISTVSQSALSHAMRVLLVADVSPKNVICALSVVSAVTFSAPRELRAHVVPLGEALWGRWMNHSARKVRVLASEMYAGLLETCSEKQRQEAFNVRLEMACKELDGIMELVDFFAPLNEAKTIKCDESIKSLSATQLANRYASVSLMLQRCLVPKSSQYFSVPVPTVLHTICRGFSEREIDPYASRIEGVQLDIDGILPLTSVMMKASLETLVALVDVLQKPGLGPYTNIIGQAFRRKMSHVVLRCRQKNGASACVIERAQLYFAIAAITDVLGSGFVENVVDLFAELFSHDVKLNKDVELAERSIAPQNSLMGITTGPRGRKRRRSSRGKNSEGYSTPLEGSTEKLVRTSGFHLISAMKKTFSAGLDVFTSFFESRGVLSDPALQVLEKLEAILSSIISKDMCCPEGLHALRAVSMGGGSTRLRAEASPLFLDCSKLSLHVLRSEGSGHAARKIALHNRSACESIIHPRGPPVIKPAHRVVDAPQPGLEWNKRNREEGKLLAGDVHIGALQSVERSEMNSGDRSAVIQPRDTIEVERTSASPSAEPSDEANAADFEMHAAIEVHAGHKEQVAQDSQPVSVFLNGSAPIHDQSVDDPDTGKSCMAADVDKPTKIPNISGGGKKAKSVMQRIEDGQTVIGQDRIPIGDSPAKLSTTEAVVDELSPGVPVKSQNPGVELEEKTVLIGFGGRSSQKEGQEAVMDGQLMPKELDHVDESGKGEVEEEEEERELIASLCFDAPDDA